MPKDQVWKWADKGQRRSKGRIYHRVIERKEDKLDIGDSAVFLSTNCPDQPYIGRLESMWETASGTKNVGVKWYYHLDEVECSDRTDRQKMAKMKRPKVIYQIFLKLKFVVRDILLIFRGKSLLESCDFAKHKILDT